MRGRSMGWSGLAVILAALAGSAGFTQEPGKTITNSIGMRLTLIPAGEFLMGSRDDDKEAFAQEKPQHRVRITQPFYLGVTEVTRGQFRRFVDETDYQTDAEKDGKGGWALEPPYCRSAWRSRHEPEFRFSTVGFRLARVQSPR